MQIERRIAEAKRALEYEQFMAGWPYPHEGGPGCLCPVCLGVAPEPEPRVAGQVNGFDVVELDDQEGE